MGLTIGKCKDDAVTRSGCGSLSGDDGKSVGSLSSRVVDGAPVCAPQELSVATSNIDLLETSTNALPATVISITVVDVVVSVDTPDVLAMVTSDTDLLQLAGNVSPGGVNSMTVEDVVVGVDTPDVVTMVSSACDLLQPATNVSPATVESTTLVDVVSGIDTPDLLAIVTTDGDLLQLATNVLPATVFSGTEEDVVISIDTPDIVSITSDTDLLQPATNVSPVTVDSITEVDLVVSVDTPGLAVVGDGDVPESTPNSAPVNAAAPLEFFFLRVESIFNCLLTFLFDFFLQSLIGFFSLLLSLASQSFVVYVLNRIADSLFHGLATEHKLAELFRAREEFIQGTPDVHSLRSIDPSVVANVIDELHDGLSGLNFGSPRRLHKNFYQYHDDLFNLAVEPGQL